MNNDQPQTTTWRHWVAPTLIGLAVIIVGQLFGAGILWEMFGGR